MATLAAQIDECIDTLGDAKKVLDDFEKKLLGCNLPFRLKK
jgi:hypothetical protein